MKALSWPGLISSVKPPGIYFEGCPRQLIRLMNSEVKAVDAKKRANPSQFSRPKTPATAPAKAEDKNFTVLRVELNWTFGG